MDKARQGRPSPLFYGRSSPDIVVRQSSESWYMLRHAPRPLSVWRGTAQLIDQVLGFQLKVNGLAWNETATLDTVEWDI